MIIAFSDDFWYLLNLGVQSIGHYFQFLIATGTYTGAFLQKGNYPGNKIEEIEWMHKNTVFYCKYTQAEDSVKRKALTQIPN